MNLFHLHVQKEQGAVPHSSMWRVVADNMFEAMSVVPDGFAVKAVWVQLGTAVDPSRVIRSIAAPVMH